MAFGGVGNIAARVLGEGTPVRLLSRRGVIGIRTPKPSISEHEWRTGDILIMHSDGVSTRWKWDSFPHLRDRPAAEIASGLLRALAKEDDDATVLVMRGADE